MSKVIDIKDYIMMCNYKLMPKDKIREIELFRANRIHPSHYRSEEERFCVKYSVDGSNYLNLWTHEEDFIKCIVEFNDCYYETEICKGYKKYCSIILRLL